VSPRETREEENWGLFYCKQWKEAAITMEWNVKSKELAEVEL
jgi:hypothetical protein